MKTIKIINPGNKPKTKKKSTNKKGVSQMATKRKAIQKKRVYKRKNPGKRIVRRAGGLLKGLNFNAALKGIPAFQFGMFAAKFAAKKFGSAASETDPESWSWDSYLKGAIGAVAGGMIAQAIKPSTGQKVLEGGLNLMVYKALQNELINGSEWATNQFGIDEEGYEQYEGLGYDDPSILSGGDDDPYFYGQDGEMYPADEQNRIEGLGDVVEAYDPNMGNALVTPGPLGNDPFAKAFLRS